MKIAVLGTGTVGPAIAGALSNLGHHVVIGTRDPEATLGRTEPGATGGPPFAEWHAAHSRVGVATYAEAAAGADLVVNATNGAGSLAALAAAGAENLAGKVLIDVANPLDFSRGFPPSLDPVNTDSLGEQIQRTFPDARVVKTLNTMTASVMVDPLSVAGGDHSVFVSGNDAGAKEVVSGLLRDLGHRDIIDLGDITTARGAEMVLPIWLRVWGALGTGAFNFKVAR
ncbi:NADPH-dependent F420 reductase [Pseudarthrobacter sp. 1C304]|uniref:NADPH-dependent F420 reductase n=1 Tax=Pseudarthrobacter sp. 1C304 TaxID=3457438 RepID=UPI003FD2D425